MHEPRSQILVFLEFFGLQRRFFIKSEIDATFLCHSLTPLLAARHSATQPLVITRIKQWAPLQKLFMESNKSMAAFLKKAVHTSRCPTLSNKTFTL